MRLLSCVRAHPGLSAFFAFLILLGIGAAAVVSAVLLDQRRAGRLISQLLTQRLGVAVEVDRAAADGVSGLTLKGVRVPPGPHWGGSVTIRELHVGGGIMPLVAPSGRHLSVVAVSTNVTLADEPTPIEPPSPDTLTAVRLALMKFLEWPADLSLEVSGGALRSGEETLLFGLKGQKAGDGRLAISLTFLTEAGARALTVDAAGAADQDGSVALRVKADGDPRRLGGLWPSAIPPVTRFTAEADFGLREAPLLEVSGRLAATPQGDAGHPITVDLAATYRADSRKVDLTRLAVGWGPDILLDLAGNALEVGPSFRLVLKARGIIDGSRLSGTVTYENPARSARGKLAATSLATASLLSRLGVKGSGLAAADLKAERADLTFSATALHDWTGVAVNGTLSIPRLEGTLGGLVLQAGLSGRWSVRLSRRDPDTRLVSVEKAAFILADSSGLPIAQLDARSRREEGKAPGPWPLDVSATLADLGRLPQLPLLGAPLKGSAHVEGVLGWKGESPSFSGILNTRLERAETKGVGAVVSGLSASIPLSWGVDDESAGALAAESINAVGFSLARLTAAARFSDGVLSLSDVAYTHYGGTGKGWAEAGFRGLAGSFRLRAEGEGIDLAALTKEYGLTGVGRVTGRVRYAMALSYGAPDGLEAAGQVTSEPPGGEVGIEALRTLLSKADADPTGVLKATLENLSVFSYSSLTGEVRTAGKEIRINLLLEGRKRLGIFPARVKAINIQNVPLSLLVRTFGHTPRRNAP